MRADMAKVIVERPRLGHAWASASGKGRQRAAQRLGLENLPRREGIKRCHGSNLKSFNEHLGPLRRYLMAQTGRPWDKVFSEICEHIRQTSVVQSHVRDHVLDYVAINIVLIAGIPCYKPGNGWQSEQPLHRTRAFAYVCPISGILKRVLKPRPRTKGKKRELMKPIVLDPTHQCRFAQGGWWLLTLKKLTVLGEQQEALPSVKVKIRGRYVFRDLQDANTAFLVPGYEVRKRRLSKAEMRQMPIPIDWQK